MVEVHRGVPADLPPPYSTLKPLTTPDGDHGVDRSDEESVSNPEISNYTFDNHPFADRRARYRFIQMVYAYILLEILIACAVNIVFVSSRAVYTTLRYDPLPWILICMLMYIIICLCIRHNKKSRKTAPWNHVFLYWHGAALAALFGACWLSSSRFIEPFIGFLVFLICTVLAQMVYNLVTYKTEWKYTFGIAVLIRFGVLIVLLGVVAGVFWDPSDYIISAIVAFLVTLYLEADVQRLMTSRRYWFTLTPQDYVYAALNAHFDFLIYIKVNYIKKIEADFMRYAEEQN